jgi:hypothetical protein
MDLTLNQNNLESYVSKIIYEENRKLDFENKYNSMSDDAKKIFHELYESIYPKSKGNINEAHWLNFVGDVVGIFDPTGLVDIANGISYLIQGDTFFGMLSLISAIPYVGDAVAKPVMLMGRGSSVIKMSNEALKLSKTNPAKAAAMISKISKENSVMGKILDKVRVWAPKLRQMVDKIPLGKLGQPFKNTIKDAIMIFEKAGAGAKKATNIARHAAKKPLTQAETVNVLNQIKKAVGQDARLFRDFGGSSVKGIQGLKNYKMSGMPRLFWSNKGIRSIMRRTKFWAGFLDYLGLANFVGPDELKAQMGSKVEEEFKKYSQTAEAQKNFDDEFADVDVNQETTTQSSSDGETASNTKTNDMTRNFLSDLIFGPITGKVV